MSVANKDELRDIIVNWLCRDKYLVANRSGWTWGPYVDNFAYILAKLELLR